MIPSETASKRWIELSAALASHETDKAYSLGTHRICDPAETYDRIRPHFARMGLTRVADVTGLDHIGIPVCMAVRPNAKSLSVSQGKGSTLMAAKVSAAMESIELYHAENIETEIVTASFSELSRRAEVLDPREMGLMPGAHFHEDLPLPWVKGYDLLGQTEIFATLEQVSVDFTHTPNDLPMFWQSSNGLASGNHILEAISHAICEVVERDAIVWWKAPIEEHGQSYVDLSTIDSPTIRGMLDLLDKAGVQVYVIDRTSPVGIPTFDCVIFARDVITAAAAPVYGGHGCHLSKEVAILRAVTEAVQSRLTLIAGSRDDMFWSDYHAGVNEVARNNWEFLRSLRPAVDYRALPSLETASLASDVAKQLSMLKQAGYERVIAFDLTKPEFGIAVARVIIPGMDAEHKGETNPERTKQYRLKKLMDWFYKK